ncbi:MAG: hypothetical protein BGO72_17560 [Burkholderiales bacterium 70-64]|nr:MAG: hypothetical protein BGO72_17560 [Burkholderiales bacterium 70-64]
MSPADTIDDAPLPPQMLGGSAEPRRIARIDPALCIGCTRCIQACPVDAIIGAARRMHTVIGDSCIGCELCTAPCPVDCIAMSIVEPARPWTDEDARSARARHAARRIRLARRRAEAAGEAPRAERSRGAGDAAPQDPAAQRKREIIAAAIRRARERAASCGGNEGGRR